MLYIITCVDKPGTADLRGENRAEHLERLKSLGPRLHMAGPTLSEDGAAFTGSVLIIDFDSLEEAEKFASQDAYTKAGVFDSVVVKRWIQVLPEIKE